MNYTAAQIIIRHLIDEKILDTPVKTAEWPVYANHLPGGKSVQQAAAVNDTESFRDGRLMEGEVISLKK